MEETAIETLPLWIWPLTVCLLALILRLWAGGGRTARIGRGGGPWHGLLAGLGQRLRAVNHHEAAPIQVLARKTIGPQHAIVLLAVWDQEVALSVQPGVSPTVVASRPRIGAQPDTAREVTQQELKPPADWEQRPSVRPGVAGSSAWGERPCS